MEMLVTKFSKGKYKNELELFSEPISKDNIKLMGEMIALQALRTVKKYDLKIADKLYIGLIKDLHHMGVGRIRLRTDCHMLPVPIYRKDCSRNLRER